jgi:hypothetical protein
MTMGEISFWIIVVFIAIGYISYRMDMREKKKSMGPELYKQYKAAIRERDIADYDAMKSKKHQKKNNRRAAISNTIVMWELTKHR